MRAFRDFMIGLFFLTASVCVANINSLLVEAKPLLGLAAIIGSMQ